MLPLSFTPIYKERVWGGRSLENIYGRDLPLADTPYGESWEISDRQEAQSIVAHGPLQGESLHDLWSTRREAIFGSSQSSERFPLLLKILDAQTDLSIQVHPPQNLTKILGGEAKTEMWYIAHAAPGSAIYVGLKNGVTRKAFEAALKSGTPDQLVHTIYPKAGDSIHIPSGRLHAIGAGLVIYEIQQNSDTTFRVFDWNRKGLNGQPRDLHIEESLQCIDFEDHEPTMDTANDQTIASCPFYHVDEISLNALEQINNRDLNRCSIITVISGKLTDAAQRSYKAGSFFILPVGASGLTAAAGTKLLQITFD